MPVWARESVSLMDLLLAEVSSSSSLTRSRMGSVWRCTYFLRANGFTRPQKPSREGGARGALPVALSVEAGADEVAAGWVWSDEVVCAMAGKESMAASGRATSRRLFINLPPLVGRALVVLSLRPGTPGACVEFECVM